MGRGISLDADASCVISWVQLQTQTLQILLDTGMNMKGINFEHNSSHQKKLGKILNKLQNVKIRNILRWGPTKFTFILLHRILFSIIYRPVYYSYFSECPPVHPQVYWICLQNPGF